MTLEFFVTEPRNPVIIYLVENNQPISQGLKFATIEGKKNKKIIRFYININ